MPDGEQDDRPPLEIRTGALLLPRASVKAVLADLPAGALRDGPRRTTPYRGDAGLVPRGESEAGDAAADLIALHLSDETVRALEGSCGPAASGCELERSVGACAAGLLAEGSARLALGLRQLSAPCRSEAEEQSVASWRARSARPEATASCSDSEGGAPFRFVELFAGIGGFRLGLEPLGGRCVLAVEIDEGARAIYEANFAGERCLGDVVALDAGDVPAHDVLTAGFPCQPFAFCNTNNASASGSLRAGPGIHDGKKGALGFEVVRILRAAQPASFLLENVPNLCSFNDGEDLKALEEALGAANYSVQWQVLDSRDFGLAQKRRRLYIVGFRRDLCAEAVAAFKWPEPACTAKVVLTDILEPESTVGEDCRLTEEAWNVMRGRDPKIVLPSGRGGRMARLDGYARTLTSSYRRNRGCACELVPQNRASAETACGDEEEQALSDPAAEVEAALDRAYASEAHANWVPRAPRPAPAWRRGQPPPRYFTQRECCRLQGFPETFALRSTGRKCQDPNRFYHYIGNAVVPPVINAIGKELLKVLRASQADEVRSGS
eukprot:TRINITY_DN21915_c0_g1_i3.p1 TRINITY_DN21915_c0_g1~~TRINITY_DN21915_c0_g1_i3.p1  ORF type:complete len:576 (-),score=136.39 TRINITY_DN21915_c0_g1_i3:127-1782(-)